MSVYSPSPATPNQALQRTAPAVTLAASAAAFPPAVQPARQPPPPLSLGSLIWRFLASPVNEDQIPRTAFDCTGGIVYFARMLDKIRLHAAGHLHADFHPNLGSGFDGRCCRFLGVEYPALCQRVFAGGSDDDILAWCYTAGTRPNEEQILIWNKFMLKRGWRDEDDGSTQELESYKASSGLAHRTDLVTFFDYYEVDEGRKP
jgi:gluconokinase